MFTATIGKLVSDLTKMFSFSCGLWLPILINIIITKSFWSLTNITFSLNIMSGFPILKTNKEANNCNFFYYDIVG